MKLISLSYKRPLCVVARTVLGNSENGASNRISELNCGIYSAVPPTPRLVESSGKCAFTSCVSSRERPDSAKCRWGPMRAFFRPFGADVVCGRLPPRLTPWATSFRPFGACTRPVLSYDKTHYTQGGSGCDPKRRKLQQERQKTAHGASHGNMAQFPCSPDGAKEDGTSGAVEEAGGAGHFTLRSPEQRRRGKGRSFRGLSAIAQTSDGGCPAGGGTPYGRPRDPASVFGPEPRRMSERGSVAIAACG